MSLVGLNNVVVVQKLSDFPAPTTGVIKLENNITYLINGSISLGTNQIERGISNLMLGTDKSNDKLIYTGTSSMIIDGVSGSNMDMSIGYITLSTISGSVFNMSGTSSNLEIRDCIFGNCNSLGNITVGNIVNFKNNLISSCANGITFTSGSINSHLSLADSISVSNTGTCTAVTVTNGTYASVIMIGLYIDVTAAQTALNIDPSITVTSGYISGSTLSGSGTKLTGITCISPGWVFGRSSGIANRQAFVFVPTYRMVAAAFTTPTTAAATLNLLGADSGNIGYTLSGTANTGVGFNLIIPKDYFSGGVFEIIYTTDTGTPANIKLQIVISKTPINAQLNTQTETGLSVTFASTTQFLRQTVTITPITTVFAADDFSNIRLHRIASDVADIFTGACYIEGVKFTYFAK